MKIFRVVKFSWFHSIHKKILMVDGCNIDERLESPGIQSTTTRYQESKESLAVVIDRIDIYPGKCGLACKSFCTVHRGVIYVSCVKFILLNLDSTAKLF